MNKYNIMYISPHLDDVVFSCSQLIRNQIKSNNKILITTIFTNYSDTHNNPFLNGKIRFKEDLNALKNLNVKGNYLNYSELMVRNNLEEYTLLALILDLIQIFLNFDKYNKLINSINTELQKIIDKNKIKSIYIPLGIGFHPDHLITYRACCNLKNVKIYGYEEFPYSQNKIYCFLRKPFIKKNKVIKVKINKNQKLKDILIYKSQFKVVFDNYNFKDIFKNYTENYYLIN